MERHERSGLQAGVGGGGQSQNPMQRSKRLFAKGSNISGLRSAVTLETYEKWNERQALKACPGVLYRRTWRK